MQRLAEVTRTRHLRFGDTIFHLEPNLKDGPGGLRDLHVSRWLQLIMALASERKWPERSSRNHELRYRCCSTRWSSSPPPAVTCITAAIATRTSSPGRRRTNWPSAGIATQSEPFPSAEWMRLYFRHARTIHRHARQMLEQASQKSLFAVPLVSALALARSSNEEFSVVDGRVYLQQIGRRSRSLRDSAAVHVCRPPRRRAQC